MKPDIKRAIMTALATVEHIDHTGDVGLRVRAATLEELFKAAALAMFDVMVEGRAEPTVEERIELSEASADRLLRSFLGELLYRFAAEGTVYSSVRIEEISSTTLKVVAAGAPFGGSGYRLKTELKAVTYHRLEVAPDGAGWRAQVIFDV